MAQETENVLGDTFIYNVYLSDQGEAYVFEYIILFMRQGQIQKVIIGQIVYQMAFQYQFKKFGMISPQPFV